MKWTIPHKARALVVAASVAIASLATAQATTLPPAIATVAKDGTIPHGEWTWLRGALPDATAEQKAEMARIEAWGTECLRADKARVAAELKALGAPPVDDSNIINSTLACAQAGALRAVTIKDPPPWPEFNARMEAARKIIDIFLYGGWVAQSNTSYDKNWSTPEGKEILRASVREQMVRKAFSWTVREESPKFDEALLPYFRAQLGALMASEDFRNTAMLKKIVEEHGWPRRSVVGDSAARMAWLIAQHADQDPAFQLRALRLMEPLTAQKEVSSPDFAYLYDRVMLKIAGKQRYGTQFASCEAGVRALRARSRA